MINLLHDKFIYNKLNMIDRFIYNKLNMIDRFIYNRLLIYISQVRHKIKYIKN